MGGGLPAPNGVICQIGGILWKFLLKGGKKNEHKFHLVNLNTIFLPRNFNGLSIRDPQIMNLDFDMNIVWFLLSYSK